MLVLYALLNMLLPDLKVNDKAEDHVPGDVEQNKNLEEYLLPGIN